MGIVNLQWFSLITNILKRNPYFKHSSIAVAVLQAMVCFMWLSLYICVIYIRILKIIDLERCIIHNIYNNLWKLNICQSLLQPTEPHSIPIMTLTEEHILQKQNHRKISLHDLTSLMATGRADDVCVYNLEVILSHSLKKKKNGLIKISILKHGRLSPLF